ncbi:collagenase [Streptomyces sp. NPDC001262]|uniref:collagenase n=1 Tax=Streptomyces sp. NPDC001262 TaxID=3364552 RepID=UPI003687B952
MLQRFTLPRCVSGGLAACVTVAGLLATPALAAAPPSVAAAGARPTASPVPPTGSTADANDRDTVQRRRLSVGQLPPLRPARTTAATQKPHASGKPAAASCTPADFGSRSGSDLAEFVKASSKDCVNTLFAVTGADAHNIFREAQMVTVAEAFESAAEAYSGDGSTGALQLTLFLRAGYYVQFNHASDVGSYGPDLAKAAEAGLDAFFANDHSKDVTSSNGDTLGEVLILTDSAGEQARYLNVYKQVLDGYDNSYDAIPSMLTAVNDVYTPLWRGNWNTAYVNAVTADPSIVDTLKTFAVNHLGLLGTDRSYLDSNAGMNVARYLEHPALRDKVRPLAKQLLDAAKITGPTAPLWVTVASQADYYDQTNCGYFGTCNLPDRLTKAALPVTHSCDSAHTISAQALTSDELAATCASVLGQDPYFHSLVKDSGAIPGQYESTIRLVVFGSRTDYQTYAGAIFGVGTDNGGITLTGDPTRADNRPTSIMYQKAQDDGFTARIWNLNHEYTHYLDARYDMKGDFTQQTAVPDVWWIEGLAEYVSYGYRGITDDGAVAEAGKHTYRLSTLFQNTYANSDVTRTYPWGYLAVRYMAEKHPADLDAMLAHFRTGDYTGGYAVYNTGIGTRYDADFDSWLTACASGACAAKAGPTADFDTKVSGLTVDLTDKSAASGNGRIAARSWDFGDGTSSGESNPSKTYASAGTYTVALTVTDDSGRTSTARKQVTVGGDVTACTDRDTRVLGRNCSRTGRSATAGNLDYLYLYLPAGTTTLTVATTGGTGDSYLYYNPGNWATDKAYTTSSTKSGTAQTITVTNTTAGYRYISLYAKTSFSGVTVTTRY